MHGPPISAGRTGNPPAGRTMMLDQGNAVVGGSPTHGAERRARSAGRYRRGLHGLLVRHRRTVEARLHEALHRSAPSPRRRLGVTHCCSRNSGLPAARLDASPREPRWGVDDNPRRAGPRSAQRFEIDGHERTPPTALAPGMVRGSPSIRQVMTSKARRGGREEAREVIEGGPIGPAARPRMTRAGGR